MPDATRGRETRIRLILAAISVSAAVLGLAFVLSVPAAESTWPYEVTRLSYLFFAAVTLAFAASLAWVAWSGEFAALAGIGLTVAVAFGLMAVLLLTLVGGESRLLVNFLLIAGVAGLGVVGYLFGARHKPRDPRLTPTWVKGVFAVVAVILLLTGAAMVLRTPDVLPWGIDQESLQLIGALFLGDAAFFLYALARPAWPNAAAAWLAFVVYDLVLVIPLVQHFSDVKAEHQTGLWIYTIVVVVTLVLGIYALVIDRKTRVIGPEAARREMRL